VRSPVSMDTEVVVYEPTATLSERRQAQRRTALTPARALIAELVRRYSVLGFECSLLEIQKLAWFLERAIERFGLPDPLDLRFVADQVRPVRAPADEAARQPRWQLPALRQAPRRRRPPGRAIWFDDARKAFVQAYLKSEGKGYAEALEFTTALIDGFESPFGMELLATVDWLLAREGVPPTVPALREGLHRWRGGPNAAERKNRLFDDRALGIALARLGTLAAHSPTTPPKVPSP
jgi:hypothetical protein